jgi:hypothetical protein
MVESTWWSKVAHFMKARKERERERERERGSGRGREIYKKGLGTRYIFPGHTPHPQ